MTINDNSTKSINAAIIDLQNQIKQLQHKIDILNNNQLKEDDIEFPGKVEYADKALEIVDYGDTQRTVKVGYGGAGIAAGELSHLAGYTESTNSSVKLKDVSKTEAKKWLEIPTTTSELTNDSGFITINDVGASFVPVTRKVNNKALSSDITLTASDVGALQSSGLSTKIFNKDDNDGLPVYHIMYDCTDIVTAEGGGKVVGFEGIAVDTRYGGYPIGNTQAITAITGWSNAFILLRHSCLTETATLINPVILKHTDGSSIKYYIALRVGGSGRQIRLFGHFTGEYIGTNILAIDVNGLPYGYELYKSSELSGSVKYADSAEYGSFGKLGGANLALSSNFNDLLNNELCSNKSGGLMGGSISTTTVSLGIEPGWWNFLYIPHRTGVGLDNTGYGTLLVTPMIENDGTLYIIHRIDNFNYNAHRFDSVT